jgi:hypothetical protein
MVLANPRDHLSIGHVERGEHSPGAMADMVVGDALDVAEASRQQELRALQRLDWVLLIAAQHDSPAVLAPGRRAETHCARCARPEAALLGTP